MFSKTAMLHMIACCLLMVAWFGLPAQILVSTDFLQERSALELQAEYGIEFRTGIDLYKLTYLTTGTDGNPDTASGLLAIPKTPIDDSFQVIAYQHGTTNGPSDVPSELGSGSDETKAYAGMGFFVSSADFLGLGESRGFHPYVHAATEASAGLDMLTASVEAIGNITGRTEADHVFVSGYSQGGHAAMALAELIQEDGEPGFEVTAATPMSGPYDLSGVMLDLFTEDVVYFFSGFMAYTLLGYQEVYGDIYNEYEDIFKSQYIPGIEAFYNRQIDLTQLTAFLLAQLVLDVGASIPSRMLKEDFIQEVKNDPDHPLRIALRDNDTHGWIPQHPMRMYYCTADEQVPYRNSIVADSIFNANGADDVMSVLIDPDAGHAECAIPAIQRSLEFFESFVFMTSVADAPVEQANMLYPNPASGKIRLDRENGLDIEWVALYSLDGRQVRSWNGEKDLLNLAGVAPGIYMVSLHTSSKTYIQKLVVE